MKLGDSGAVLVEFAIILPVMLLLTLGIFDIGIMLLQSMQFVEHKLRQRQLSNDGNVEISGRDLRCGPGEDRTETRGNVSNQDPKLSLVTGNCNGEICH